MPYLVQVCLHWSRYSKSRIMRPMSRILALLVLLAAMPAPIQSAQLDLLIRNGIVIDGTGTTGFPADIGIDRDGRIAFVGENPSAFASTTINAQGPTIAPGYSHVIGNREPVIRADQHHGTRPGQTVRRGQ